MPKNIKKLLASLLFVIAIFPFGSIDTMALNYIDVKLNGVSIKYESPFPQLIDSRTVVPIRTTAEALGATIDWNSEVSTMTIVKGDRMVLHRINTNYVTVITGGESTVVTFDTPSITIDGRSMMPVRMLSESLGNIVSWDSATSSVNIIDDGASILGINASHSHIESGQEVLLNVTTNSSTSKVKVVEEQSKDVVVAEGSVFTVNDDGTRTFDLVWTPISEVDEYKTVKVIPGNSYSYLDDNYRIVSVNISAVRTPQMLYFSTPKLEVARDESFEVTVETNSATDFVLLEASDGSLTLDMTEYTLKASDTNIKVFKEIISFDNTGAVTLKAYPGSTGVGYLSEYKFLNMMVSRTTSSSSSGSSGSTDDYDIEIEDVYAFYDDVFEGQEAQIIIITTANVVEVEILDSSDKHIDSTAYKSATNSTQNIFELYAELESGRNRFTIVAYDKNDNEEEISITITAGSYDEDDLEILNIQQRDLDVLDGESVNLRVITTDSAEDLEIYDNSGNQLSFASTSSSSSAGKVWNITNLKITESIKDNLKIVVYDGFEEDEEEDDTDTEEDDDEAEETSDSVVVNSVSSTVDIFLNSETAGSIEEILIENNDNLEVGDKLELTIYTNKVISKVWVEDEDGKRVATQYYPNDETSTEDIWYLDFYVKSSGRYYYDVYAQDSSGDIISEYFYVRVYDN